MTRSDFSTLACRHCRHYHHEGRRGGHCHQLNVSVQGSWKACALMIPPFTPSWQSLRGIMLWQQAILSIQESVVAGYLMMHDSLEDTDPVHGEPGLSSKKVAME